MSGRFRSRSPRTSGPGCRRSAGGWPPSISTRSPSRRSGPTTRASVSSPRAARPASPAPGTTRRASAGGLLVLTRLPIRSARFDALRAARRSGPAGSPGLLRRQGLGDARARDPRGSAGVGRHPSACPLHERRPARLPRASRRPDRRSWRSRRASCGTRSSRWGTSTSRTSDPEHAILTGLTGLRDVAAELGRPSATVAARESLSRAQQQARSPRRLRVRSRRRRRTASSPLQHAARLRRATRARRRRRRAARTTRACSPSWSWCREPGGR